MSAKASTVFKRMFLAMGAVTAIAVAGSAVAQYESVQSPLGTNPTTPVATTPSNSSAARNPAPANGGAWWTDLFAYPKGGQSVEQQNRDRMECRTWAVTQTGFDPAKVTQDSPTDYAAKRDSYLRAEAACLQARNYSVK